MNKTLKTVGDFTRTRNIGMPKADLSNSGKLLTGDPMIGGPDPMTAWKLLSGEPDDYSTGEPDDYSYGDADDDAMEGGPRKRRSRFLRLPKMNTIGRTGKAARMMGKISRSEKWNFMYVSGGIMNTSPIPETMGFPSATMSDMLNRQNTDTPFLLDQAPGSAASPTSMTASLVGPATLRLAPIIWVKVGTNMFSGIPNSLISMTLSIPLFQSTAPLVIAAPPITFTYNGPFSLTFGIVPWTIVSSIPTATLAQYGAAPGQSIDVTVSGLPSASSSLTIMVPGTQHKWTQGMRNAFLKG